MMFDRFYPRPHHSLREAFLLTKQMYPGNAASPRRSAALCAWISARPGAEARAMFDALLASYGTKKAARIDLKTTDYLLAEIDALITRNEEDDLSRTNEANP